MELDYREHPKFKPLAAKAAGLDEKVEQVRTRLLTLRAEASQAKAETDEAEANLLLQEGSAAEAEKLRRKEQALAKAVAEVEEELTRQERVRDAFRSACEAVKTEVMAEVARNLKGEYRKAVKRLASLLKQAGEANAEVLELHRHAQGQFGSSILPPLFWRELSDSLARRGDFPPTSLASWLKRAEAAGYDV